MSLPASSLEHLAALNINIDQDPVLSEDQCNNTTELQHHTASKHRQKRAQS